MIGRLKRFVQVIAIGAIVALPQSASAADMEAELKAKLETLRGAFIDKDGAKIKAMMTKDGLLITPFFSAALTPDEITDKLSAWPIRSNDSHRVVVTPLDADTGLMTLYTSFEGTFDGKPLPPWVFATAVWVKQDGAWRTKLYQETAVNAP